LNIKTEKYCARAAHLLMALIVMFELATPQAFHLTQNCGHMALAHAAMKGHMRVLD
jgi:hypothetical protein